MTIKDIRQALGARIICGDHLIDREVHSACGSDMLSDVLAFVEGQGGFTTDLQSQVIRTAEMMDIVCIVFVEWKCLMRQ